MFPCDRREIVWSRFNRFFKFVECHNFRKDTFCLSLQFHRIRGGPTTCIYIRHIVHMYMNSVKKGITTTKQKNQVKNKCQNNESYSFLWHCFHVYDAQYLEIWPYYTCVELSSYPLIHALICCLFHFYGPWILKLRLKQTFMKVSRKWLERRR